MKKIKLLIFSFAALFVALININAYASTSLNISSSSSVTVGNTITTTVTLSSSNPLGSWNFVLGYDTTKLTLLDNTSQRIVGYGDGTTKSKSYTFKFKAKTVGTAKVYIDSASYYTWNEASEAVTKGSKTITIKAKETNTTTSYSKDNYLTSLGITDHTLTPDFNKETLEYSVLLPENTYSINVTGKLSDDSAKVTGLGDQTLTDGENKLEIKVTAENGNIRTYVINATVEEADPIKVIINGDEYTVVRKKDGIKIPNNYRETTASISGVEVLAFYGEITNYNLLALKNSSGEINLYIYDLSNNTYTLYQELNFNSINIYPYLIGSDKIIDDYEKTTITINGMEVDALKKGNNYPVVYGMNLNSGEISYYTYDAKENTLQRYNLDFSSKLEKENQKYFYVIVGLGSFCLLELLLIIIILISRNNKNSRKLENTISKTIELNSIEADKISKKMDKKNRREDKKRLKKEQNNKN